MIIFIMILLPIGVSAEDNHDPISWPNPPPINVTGNFEKIRKLYEEYRQKLENCRKDIEKQRKKQKITERQYQKEFKKYKYGIAVYREGIEEYKELSNQPISNNF